VKNASIQKPTLAKKHDSVNYRMKIISESADADLNLNTLNVHTKVLPMWERNTLQQCNIALPNLILDTLKTKKPALVTSSNDEL